MAHHDQISEERIVELISKIPDGYSLKQACDEAGLNYPNIVTRIGKSDLLTKVYAQAREDHLTARVESMHQLEGELEKEIKHLEDKRVANAMVQLARLKCDNIKWEAERILRRMYGQNVQVNHGGAVSFSITGFDTNPPQPKDK